MISTLSPPAGFARPDRAARTDPRLPEHISPTAAKAYLGCGLRFSYQLMSGLGRLRETAVELAGSDAREIAARFGAGSLGRRKLAVA